MSEAKIMRVGEGASGVPLGIAAECHRQNALALSLDFEGKQRARAAYVALTGMEPARRDLNAYIPEYAM